MPAALPYSVESAALRIEFGELPQLSEPADYAELARQLRTGLCILQHGELLLESAADFPLLEFALDFASWSCPHSWWLFNEHPGLREWMEHLPDGLGAYDFAWLGSDEQIYFGFRAAGPALVLPTGDELRDTALDCSLEDLQWLGNALLQKLSEVIASELHIDISPLVARDWRSRLSQKPQRGSVTRLDIAARLAWQQRESSVSCNDWQLSYSLDEISRDASSAEELPNVVSGSLVLKQRIAVAAKVDNLPLLEFLLTALDWLSDSLHASRSLHRSTSADNTVWGGYELGQRSDGRLLLALRRRSASIEILAGSSRLGPVAVRQDEFGRLLLDLATQLARELHERTGWSALRLFARGMDGKAEQRPAELPEFNMLELVLGWQGSREIAGRSKRLPQRSPLESTPHVALADDAPAKEAAGLQVDISLLDFDVPPTCLADLQESLRCSLRICQDGNELLDCTDGLPLLDFCINCLCWLCRHESVSLARSRESDARRRGRPQDFILEYPGSPAMRIGLHADMRGYGFVLERDGRRLTDRRIGLGNSEAWLLLFDISRAIVTGVQRRWGWDIRPLFGPAALRMSERPLQKVESIGYMNLERDIKDLSDIRHGIVKGPAGCMRI